MSTVILACESLSEYINQAQRTQKTNYSVVKLDRTYHEFPERMREHILSEIEKLPEEVDTVLVAMGFCGGSWENITTKKKVVIPHVDDCVTLVLHQDEEQHLNLKEAGHLYLMDPDVNAASPKSILKDLVEKYGEEMGEIVFEEWFKNYTNLDVVDSGVYDCHTKEYKEDALENAELIHSKMQYVGGSNILMEKMVSGRWDQQFLVFSPGEVVKKESFVSI